MRRTKAYQGALEAVFALLISLGIGWWVDDRFDTAPLWLMVGLVIGFASMVLRLVRMRSILEEDPEVEPPKEGS